MVSIASMTQCHVFRHAGGYVAAFSPAAAPALRIRLGSASPSPTWYTLVRRESDGALQAAARIQRGRRAVLPLSMSGSADDLLKSAAEAIEKEAPPKPTPVAATKPGGWEGGLGALRKVQAASGGVMEELTFEAPEPAMKMLKKGEDRVVQALSHFGSREGGNTGSEGAQSGLKLYDLSHWGVIEVQGDDRLTFLNGQCTANIKDAEPMDAMRACFTNKVITTMLLLMMLVSMMTMMMTTMMMVMMTMMTMMMTMTMMMMTTTMMMMTMMTMMTMMMMMVMMMKDMMIRIMVTVTLCQWANYELSRSSIMTLAAYTMCLLSAGGGSDGYRMWIMSAYAFRCLPLPL